MEWSAGRLTLQTQWFLMGKMWRSSANILASSAASPQPRPALMESCSHQPATLVNLDRPYRPPCSYLYLLQHVSQKNTRGGIDSHYWQLETFAIFMHLLFVFQSPRGCSINSSPTGWSQRLKHVSLVTWSDDLHAWPPTHASHHDTVWQYEHLLTHAITQSTPCPLCSFA